jgi:DNA-directed RNA polymerase subunit RPC12/RpoP
MSAEQIDLLCPHCSQTFSTFLQEMADKNAKVVCPHCGASVPVPERGSGSVPKMNPGA